MANNRMWLVHKPTGRMHLIAKHFGNGWQAYEAERKPPYFGLQELFNLPESWNSTEFVIEYDSLPRVP